MQKNHFIHHKTLFFIFFVCLGGVKIEAQTCSEAAMFQKYWQYRNRFNRSFIVNDRDSSGCVNDGIGFTRPTQASSTCQFSKQGYGLPATRLVVSPSGWGMPGVQVNGRFPDDTTYAFEDRDCAGSISGWGETPVYKHNWMDFGSETLTQLGWNFVRLATEYELLGRSGQTAEQQKVLEEIFLGIQAIRRLDMQAQCMIKQMYDSRKGKGELVCDYPYTTTSGLNWPINPPPHRHWDSKVKDDCEYTPDFSGFNGFFIRCDATQDLENILHDSTDGSWNVDAIGGDFGGLNSDSSDLCDDVDPLCWMAHRQHFISQDQLINLFYGFSFIKRYIPESATVTTCDGDTFRPLDMVQQLASVIADKINENGDHITLPGSDDCCEKPVKLSECEGGNMRVTMYGLLKAKEYITGEPTRTTLMQQLGFELFPANAPKKGLSFYLKQSCMFKDLSKVARSKRNKMVEIAISKNKEILLLGNDLLFPGGGESMAEKLGGKEFFKKMLCSAPCGGPCHAGRGFDSIWPGPTGDGWPEFECPNTPGWEGNRWDGEGESARGLPGPPTRTNGLDYMALFNMYMLQYGGSNDFYNPTDVQPSQLLTLYGTIDGPDVLCPNQLGKYEISGYDPAKGFSNITWTANNMALSASASPVTRARINAGQTSGTINLTYSVSSDVPQYYGHVICCTDYSAIDSITGEPTYPFTLETVQDQCLYAASKNVQIAAPDIFSIEHQIDPCMWVFQIWAVTPDGTQPNGITYNWTIIHEDLKVTGTGVSLDFIGLFSSNYQNFRREGAYHVILETDNGCGSQTTAEKTIYVTECFGPQNKYLDIDPNPAGNIIRVYVKTLDITGNTDALVSFNNPNGYASLIKRTDWGPALISSKIYNNGAAIDVSSLPDGHYNLTVNYDGSPISRAFIIAR